MHDCFSIIIIRYRASRLAAEVEQIREQSVAAYPTA